MQEPLFAGTGEPSDCAGMVRWVTGWFLAACVVIIAVGCPSLAAASPPVKNVLVLYSFTQRDLFDDLEPLKASVRSHVPVPVNFYVEYLESKRFAAPGFQESLRENLRLAYKEKALDLVVVGAYPALRFAIDNRDRIFPGVPIVFISITSVRLQGQVLGPGVTGITETADVHDPVDLALRLHPDTKNVVMITGASEFERYWLEAFRDEFHLHEPNLKLFDLSDLPSDELLNRVATLPPHTIVFFQLMPQDSAQPVIGTVQLLTAIAKQVPTYCVIYRCFDHGGIGGSYFDGIEEGAKGGEIAARVLSGEKPESIPVAHVAERPTVDWRQLRRWNIPESSLPPGTIVLYRQPTVWERYERYIVAGVVLIVVQALLIIALLWQRARKKSATAALRTVAGRLIRAHEEERARIARELHDDFSQRLAVQCIELVQLRKNLPESEVEERARALKVLKETKEMSADIRSLSHQLHSSRLELVGLMSAFSGLCEEVTKKYKIDVHFTHHEFPINLGKDVELCLFRVAQEALGNVVKHSQARSAQVELGATAKVVSLRISDTGKGFEPDVKSAGAGIGLIGMRERLRLVGGKLSIRSELMRGTEILAEVPLSTSANKEQVEDTQKGGWSFESPTGTAGG